MLDAPRNGRQFSKASNVFYPQNAAMMKMPRKSETFFVLFSL